MKVVVEDTGPCRKTLKITLPVERINEEHKRVLNAYRKQVKIPGFRPGRAPEQMVKMRFGKDMAESVKENLIPDGYREAVKQEDLNVVSVLGVRDVEFSEGQPMQFTVMLDILPEFKLPEYKGLSLKGEKVEVDEAEVDKAQDELLDQYATFEEVTDRPVETGDFVQVDYEGTCDGEPIEGIDPDAKGLGQAADFWVRTDENSFLPGFGEGLVGVSINENKTLNISFADDFSVSALAGRQGVYAVTVKAIRERRRPELDETLLKQFGVESEDALRKHIRDDLQGSAEQQEQGRLKSEIVKMLMSKTNIDVPASEVDEETRNIIYDVVNRNASRGVSKEEIEEKKDEIFESASQNAQERVKIRYILHRIADEEDLQVSDEELNQHLKYMAARYGVEEAKMRADLEARNVVDNIREDLRSGKTMDFLLDEANVKV